MAETIDNRSITLLNNNNIAPYVYNPWPTTSICEKLLKILSISVLPDWISITRARGSRAINKSDKLVKRSVLSKFFSKIKALKKFKISNGKSKIKTLLIVKGKTLNIS